MITLDIDSKIAVCHTNKSCHHISENFEPKVIVKEKSENKLRRMNISKLTNKYPLNPI